MIHITKYLVGEGDLLKLGRLNDIEDLLQLVEEHHLLGAVHLRPVPSGWSTVS